MNKPLVVLTSLIWTASLICLSKAVKSSCRSIDVKEGNDANVTCTFAQDISQSKPLLYVYHNEETVVTCTWPGGKQNCISKLGNYHIVGSVTNQLTLNIDKVSRSDGGHFRCIPQGFISDEITPCLLNVAAVASSCQNMSVREGNDVNVTCTFYQDIAQSTQVLYVYRNEETVVTCTWPRGRQNCISKLKNYHIVGPITNQLTLNITEVTRSDDGQFRCIPERSLSNEIIPCHLNVATVASSCRNMSVKEGNDVNVTCTFYQDIIQSTQVLYVYHNEETVVTCTWPGRRQNCISKIRNYHIAGPITNQLTLNIAKVTRSDGGQFRCIPERAISNEIIPCHLNVASIKSSCEIGILHKKQRHTNRYYERKTALTCRFDDDISEGQHAVTVEFNSYAFKSAFNELVLNLTWHDGEPIVWTQYGYELQGNITDIMTIQLTDSDESGIYTCRVTHSKEEDAVSCDELPHISYGTEMNDMGIHFFHLKGYTFCESPAVSEGENATISCYFSVSRGDYDEYKLYFMPNHTNSLKFHDVCCAAKRKLTCKIYSPESVLNFRKSEGRNAWLKSGYTLGDVTSNYLVVNIPQVKKENAGRYVCRVSRYKEEDATPCFLHVSDSPAKHNHRMFFVPPRVIITAEIGSSILQTCVADCQPECSLSWQKLAGGSYADVEKDGALSIQRVQREVHGLYRCVAENAHGRAFRPLTVVVIDRLRIAHVQEAYFASANEPVNITFQVEGYPIPSIIMFTVLDRHGTANYFGNISLWMNIDRVCSHSITVFTVTILNVTLEMIDRRFVILTHNFVGMLLIESILADKGFTIEVTNSSNGIFTAKEDTFQHIATTVTPVTSCNEWELSVSENKFPMCKFAINPSDVCTVTFGPDKCTCGSRGTRGQEFHFNKNVTRKDNGAILKWNVELTHFKINSSKTVTLNITYPTRVTSLYVEGYGDVTPVPVSTDTSVKVVCSWLDGNPPAAVHLFNSSDDKSSTATSSNSTHIYFTHHRCHHVEVVRCEAFGSERNQSMSLLGLCPPVVSNSTGRFLNVTAGETVSPSFSVLSHTLKITRCQLRQNIEVADVTVYSANDSKTNKVKECALIQNSATHHIGNEPNEKEWCECIVNGTVPDITVTVRIINVNKEDAGNWTVNVFNSLGSVSFNFSLSVSEKQTKWNVDSNHDNINVKSIILVVAITCGTLICIVIVALIVHYTRKRVAGAPLRHSNGQSETAECSTREEPTDNFFFQSENPYDEINDAAIEIIITNNVNNRPSKVKPPKSESS